MSSSVETEAVVESTGADSARQLQSLLEAAAECGGREDWSAARQFIALALDLAPQDAEINAMLGQLDFQLEDFPAAVVHLGHAARLGATDCTVFVNLAISHLKTGDSASAESTLMVAALIFPDDERILAGLAELRRAAGRQEEALANYARLAEVAPQQWEYQIAAARCLREMERWSEAQQYLDRGRALAPTHEAIAAEEQALAQAKRRFFNAVFEGEHRRISVLPGCRYASCAIPLDYPPSRALEPRWGGTRPVHARLHAQFSARNAEYRDVVRNVRSLEPWFRQIQPVFASHTAPEPGWTGAAMNALDLALLYFFVQHYRPATYLEIGSGASTCFARRAVADHKLPTRIVSIDPEPRAAIDRICDEVIRSGLETLSELNVFANLEPGDIVFMDGSHRTFMNSDVTVFMLDILPMLRPGVIVHIHDIALPYDYADMFRHWYWNEQYIVGTYLMAAAERVEVLMPVNHVATDPAVRDCLEPPILTDVGEPETWRNGGSLWFTHR